MRVTDGYRFETYKNNLSLLKAKMDKATTQVSSGNKILVPSDDPGAFSKNIEVTSEKSQNNQYKKNLTSLQTAGSYYQTAMNTLGNILTTVQQLAIQSSSDTVDADSRLTAADQIDDIIEQLVALGNTKVGSTYIFGGKASNTVPYASDGTFSGTTDVTKVSVDSASTIDGSISGDRIFKGTADGTSVDIFATLKQFSTDLRANNLTGIRTDLGNVGNCVTLTADNLAYVGTYTANIKSLLASNATATLSLTKESSSLVGVDIAEAITDYSTISTAYQAALMTMSKVMNLNILDYMPA
jgi:flagellar hook-associated protein 3 FlgL